LGFIHLYRLVCFSNHAFTSCVYRFYRKEKSPLERQLVVVKTNAVGGQEPNKLNKLSQPRVASFATPLAVPINKTPQWQPTTTNTTDTLTITAKNRSGFITPSATPATNNPPTAASGSSNSWYAQHVDDCTLPSLNPDDYSFLDWKILETGRAVLNNTQYRPHHTAGEGREHGYVIPNLEDPFRDLVKGVVTTNSTGILSFKLPNGFPPKLCARILGNVVVENVMTPWIFITEALPLWLNSQRNLSKPYWFEYERYISKPVLNRETKLAYTQTDKDLALKDCLRLIGKNSIGFSKFMQIISNNSSAKNSMPDAVYQALKSFQSDLPPSWKPKEVVKLIESQFEHYRFIEQIANRPENKHRKEALLRDGKVVIELLKDKNGKIEPLGVASTAEVYQCKLRVVSKKDPTRELLSQRKMMGDEQGRIIKVLKKNLVVPQWWEKNTKLEDLPKKQLARDKELLTKLFTLISDDPRVLDYWLGQVNKLCESWEPELDLRNGAENGKILAEAAILRDKNGQPLQLDVEGNPYPMYDVALSDFATSCIDLQVQAKGISLKQLMETKEYTRNIVSEGLIAYLDQHPQATLREILASEEAKKSIAITGLQRFKLDKEQQKHQTQALEQKMELLWENAPIAHKPPAQEVASSIQLTNQLEVALESIISGVHTNALNQPASTDNLQTMVNDILVKQLKDANSKVLLKSIELIQQYPWLVNDPHLMTQVGESFAQATATQMTQTTIREGDVLAKIRLHMDVTQANAFVYRDDKLYEKLKGEVVTKDKNSKKDSSLVLLQRAQKILFDPTVTDKSDKLIQLGLEGNINPYRIQYIDTGGVQSLDSSLFIDDLKLVLGYCTGNPKQLQDYFKSQVTYEASLTEIEKKRLLKAHNLPSLLNEQKLPELVTVFTEELYSERAKQFLANNPSKKTLLEQELAVILKSNNPLENFFNKLLEDRQTLFEAELPSLFNQHIFEIKDNVQNFELAWNLVQSELSRRRIGYNYPNFDVLKAKLLQVTTGYGLLEMAGGDHNDLLVKSLLRIFYKAHSLNGKAFTSLAKETLTHAFIAQPEQAGKMMALFLPQATADLVTGFVKQANSLKQVVPWAMAGLGATALAGVGILKYNEFERDQIKHKKAEREEKAFIANIALAQKQNRKLSKTTPSLKQKGLLG